VREAEPAARERVEVWRLDHGVSGAAERVVPPVVREQDNDIQRAGIGSL
jgi:hypothetical protein